MAPVLRAFHYSFVVRDLEEARRFYVDIVGCREGRSAATWVDFELFGNQLSCHVGTPSPTAFTGRVDDIAVPMPHFGVIVTFPEYDALAARVTAANIPFVVTPRIRYGGEVGEQGTCFFLDPSGNAIEIKAFRRADEVFAR
ncbi:MAG TPA: VOC family protein [Kofleriaceae bacterium]